ncbi:MAG TPA: DUF4064 domain-containing protein [Chloroflexota bacterium]
MTARRRRQTRDGQTLGTEGASTVVGLGWAALGLSVLGIIGGALALAKPRLAGLLLLIAGIGGTISISLAYVVAGPLLVIGGILALVGGRRKSATRQATPAATQPSTA